MKCKSCGAGLDLTMTCCPACGAAVELGRLTGILGLVCRACDAYNDPGAKTCAACGKPLGEETPPATPAPRAAPAAPPPAVGPVVRSFAKGAPTRFVPSVLRPSAESRPASGTPAHTLVSRVATCPRCGADAGQGRFCAQCGQPLGMGGAPAMSKPAPAGRTAAAQASGALAPGRAKLVLEAGGGIDGATWPLNAESVEAGRARGAVVFPGDECLAPHHATFFYRGGALHVRDEGAQSGVYLCLRGLSAPLRPGDHFAIGERLLRYAGPLAPAPIPPPDGTRRLGAPRPAAPAIVVEERLEGGACGRVFVRGGPAVTFGRTGCAVNLGDDPHLAQAHAEIAIDAEGGARLRDLGSSYGTFVRIPPRAERELRDGDRLRMGREVLRVVVAG